MTLPSIQKLLSDIHTLTGLSVNLYDDQCRGLFHSHNDMGFCAYLHTNTETVERCRHFDKLCFQSAREAGDAVALTCPFGVFAAICPIYDGTTLLGFLQFDGVISTDAEVEQAGLQNALAFVPHRERLVEKRLPMPRKSPEELRSALSLLRTVCRHIELGSLFPRGEISLGLLAKRYVKHNLQSKLALCDIAAHLHCSKATLTETFRREFGMTVVQYINRNRLEKACHLLINTELSISTICEECGFSGGEYFSALFKKVYALSPLAYRKAARKNDLDATAPEKEESYAK